ncbi:Rne/Rng family ribonuclease [Candidatus Acetothermia bacterium]|nr:Rne/Rng family ribonuclease [Candidatus Acetothermia bacterium]
MEIYYETAERILGNVYKGVIKDVLAGMSSAFVDVGLEENLFLSAKEINEAILRSHHIRRHDSFPIQKVVKSGQPITIQVKREGIGTKNPQGTTKISLPGRYWVFLPKDGRLGISRRIESETEVRRLKKIAKDLKRLDEGLIARTAAQGATRDDLERDFNFLLGNWKGIEDEAERVRPPTLLYQGMDLVRTLLRDRLLEDVERVVIDSGKKFDEIRDFLRYMHMDEFETAIQLYQDRRPLFEMRGVEAQIRESLEKRVALPGGGSLVIEETEALTAIDVNTGSDVKHKDQEMAILNTNLEAAMELPRQLRLRKLSGIIVVDFIDMKRRDHESRVLKRLREELRKDRVPSDLVDITQLGLVEITRKREGESLADMMTDEENDDED